MWRLGSALCFNCYLYGIKFWTFFFFFLNREQNSSGHSQNISDTGLASLYPCHSVIRYRLKDVVHDSLWFFWKLAQYILIYTVMVWGWCSRHLTVMKTQHNERAYDQHNWCGRGHHFKDYHWSIAKQEANPQPQGWFPTQKSFATIARTPHCSKVWGQ